MKKLLPLPLALLLAPAVRGKDQTDSGLCGTHSQVPLHSRRHH
jgi:hypothetical protein